MDHATSLSFAEKTQWLSITACPYCDSKAIASEAKLAARFYNFGNSRIPVPIGTGLVQCGECSLVYKTIIPGKGLLSKLTAATQASLWASNYDHAAEIEKIRSEVRGEFSVIDIGAAGGEFLNAMAPYAQRRSALDILHFERLNVSANGEFITGFLDSPNLIWSEYPYDVVTAFDIFEHLYDPKSALKNIAKLVKPGGLVVIETGDASAVRRTQNWYYMTLFEHHICWSPRSIARAAEDYGFEIISIENKYHKGLLTVPKATGRLKRLAYELSPRGYHFLQALGGFDGSTPLSPGLEDHLRVILKKSDPSRRRPPK